MYFLKLIRWPNLLIIAASMYLLRYYLLLPLLESYGIGFVLSHFNFFVLCFSTILLTAAGYIINDIQDVDADKVNKPDKVIIGNNISAKAAENIYLFLNALAIGGGVYISYQIDMRSISLAFLLVAGLLYFYSTTYKGMLVLGNIMVAFFAALVPIMVLLFELPLLQMKYKVFVQASDFNFNFVIGWFGFYAAFAFLINLVREIIKDMEDFEGDNAYGQHTLPVAYGINLSKIIVLSLIGITILFALYLIIRYLHDPISLMYIISAILSPLFFIAYTIYNAKTKIDYTTASKWSKIVMLTGIMYVFLAHFLFLKT